MTENEVTAITEELEMEIALTEDQLGEMVESLRETDSDESQQECSPPILSAPPQKQEEGEEVEIVNELLQPLIQRKPKGQDPSRSAPTSLPEPTLESPANESSTSMALESPILDPPPPTLTKKVKTLIPDPPSIREIAVGLASELRWVGQTIKPWTVLHHVLVGYTMIPEDDPIRRFEWLFHDSEEIYTGDIPKPFKTQEQRELGNVIRRMIFRETLRFPYPEHLDGEGNGLDGLLADAEANVLLSPQRKRSFVVPQPSIEMMFAVWDMVNIDIHNDGVSVFLGLVEGLLGTQQVKTMQARV